MKSLLLISVLLPLWSLSQSGIVMTGNSFIVIDNSAKLVIENSAPNALVNFGIGGIMTESEFDQVCWMIGSSTGNYIVPYVSQLPAIQIPFRMNITTPGSLNGTLRLSTFPGASFDNNLFKPSDVTHMFDYNTNTVNNSSHVIDRFWIADANTYTTKPSAIFEFTYRDNEHLLVGNTIVEGALGAQRFNSGTNQWGDYFPQGSTNVAANTTSGVPVAQADFFRSWTLSETSSPLPVELAFFKSSCNTSQIVLSWQTLSEINTDHFEIEVLNDNEIYVFEGFISANGNGYGINTYEYYPQNLRTGTFRLVEITTDGERLVKSTVSSNCGKQEFIAGYDAHTNSLYLSFEGQYETSELLSLYDSGGKLIHRIDLSITKGINSVIIPDVYLSNGMYLISFLNGEKQLTAKILAVR